jgi:hypothetical protein
MTGKSGELLTSPFVFPDAPKGHQGDPSARPANRARPLHHDRRPTGAVAHAVGFLGRHRRGVAIRQGAGLDRARGRSQCPPDRQWARDGSQAGSLVLRRGRLRAHYSERKGPPGDDTPGASSCVAAALSRCRAGDRWIAPASLTTRLVWGVCESGTGVGFRGRTVDGGTSPRARWLPGV